MEPGFAAAEIDTSKPHPARMYNAYLGGNDNYPADRAAVRQIMRVFPEVRAMAVANRAFMQRAVRFLAAEAGIRQFLDIGTGIPSAGNVHEVAGRAAPDARVVYVDNDPIVHVHANALLTGSGTTGIVLADLRDPAAILAHPSLRELIDFTRPVALLLVAILHFVKDEEDPAGIVASLRDALPDGSYLVLSHGTRTSTRPAARTRPPPGTRTRPPRWYSARTSRCPRSSTGSACWNRAWCRPRCGDPMAGGPARGILRKSASTPASDARPLPAPDAGLLSRRTLASVLVAAAGASGRLCADRAAARSQLVALAGRAVTRQASRVFSRTGRFQRAEWSSACRVLIRMASSRRANGWVGALRM